MNDRKECPLDYGEECPHLENFAIDGESLLKDWYEHDSGPLENMSGNFNVDINVIPYSSGSLSDLGIFPKYE